MLLRDQKIFRAYAPDLDNNSLDDWECGYGLGAALKARGKQLLHFLAKVFFLNKQSRLHHALEGALEAAQCNISIAELKRLIAAMEESDGGLVSPLQDEIDLEQTDVDTLSGQFKCSAELDGCTGIGVIILGEDRKPDERFGGRFCPSCESAWRLKLALNKKQPKGPETTPYVLCIGTATYSQGMTNLKFVEHDVKVRAATTRIPKE